MSGECDLCGEHTLDCKCRDKKMHKKTPKRFPPKVIYEAFETLLGSSIKLTEYIFTKPDVFKDMSIDQQYYLSLIVHYYAVLMDKSDDLYTNKDISNTIDFEPKRREAMREVIRIAEEFKLELGD